MKKIIIALPAFMFFFSCQKTNNATNNTSVSNLVTSPIIANQIKFSGNGFVHNGLYPKLYTCDSLGISPGLQWSNAPSNTNSYAITMYTIPGPGDKHVYIVLYNIPASTTSIPNNSKSIGVFGINTVDGKTTYTPPCSQGPGAKIYVLTIYALNAPPTITVPNTQVTMDILLAGMKNKIVDSAVMSVTYTRP
ncbi:MAG: YbhB/YbcL family Raf kinase inhibitor-like protein [Chitinophagia bacterium]